MARMTARWIGVVAAVGLVLTACGGGDDKGPGGTDIGKPGSGTDGLRAALAAVTEESVNGSGSAMLHFRDAARLRALVAADRKRFGYVAVVLGWSPLGTTATNWDTPNVLDLHVDQVDTAVSVGPMGKPGGYYTGTFDTAKLQSALAAKGYAQQGDLWSVGAPNGMYQAYRVAADRLEWTSGNPVFAARESIPSPRLSERPAWRAMADCLGNGVYAADILRAPEERASLIGIGYHAESAAKSSEDVCAVYSNPADAERAAGWWRSHQRPDKPVAVTVVKAGDMTALKLTVDNSADRPAGVFDLMFSFTMGGQSFGPSFGGE
ncbi:hypothetical protein [Yinghuangia seranimata]|uniref:hypothetical protein n=1 Tax=Yinghuangia seranimata TaxID=408067 RepID=UPI00248A8F6C|nr:hypothetical protein [Yinghuangia seranimata]MDI2130585.1 hypothetical protein [Yinghuangia seranimata]